MGPSGTLWASLGHFWFPWAPWPIWHPFGPFWGTLVPFRFLWVPLGPLVIPVGPYHIGPLCANLGPHLAPMVPFGPLRTTFDTVWAFWYLVDPFGPIWVPLDTFGPWSLIPFWPLIAAFSFHIYISIYIDIYK